MRGDELADDIYALLSGAPLALVLPAGDLWAAARAASLILTARTRAAEAVASGCRIEIDPWPAPFPRPVGAPPR